MKYILFICGKNAGRSQMAQAYFNHRNTNKSLTALSAGNNPAKQIDQNAVRALQEDGIEIANHPDYYPKTVTEEHVDNAIEIYTMGCQVACPTTGKPIAGDFGLDDPHEKSLDEVRRIYKILKEKLDPIIEKHNRQVTEAAC